MKILLINPPVENSIQTNVPEFVDESSGVYPPLGLLYIASNLQKFSNHEVIILDSLVESLNYKDLTLKIKNINPDVVGLSAFTFSLLDLIKLCRIIKNINKKIIIIVGGPHANIYPKETVNLKNIDYVLLGEAEKSFTQLVNLIEKNKSFKKVPGLVYKKSNKVHFNKSPSFIDDLDELPFPARNLTHYRKYYSLLAKKSPITTMITSRGCPFKCIFCDRPHLGKKFRFRSANNVVDEFDECARMGIKEIFIYDDTFTLNKKRVYDICNEIKRRRIKISWDIRTRVDSVDYDLLKILKSAGCERVHFGVEAGNQRILNNLQKGITIEQVFKAFKSAKKIGLTTLAYFMIGSPGERKKDILQSIKLAKKLKADYTHFAVTTPYPCTELYTLGLKIGVLKEDYWQKFAANPQAGFIPNLWDENLSRKELLYLLRKAYKNFYLRPNYILKDLMNIKSFDEFKRKFRAGLKLIGY